MSRTARTWLFLAGAGGVAALLAWGLFGLPDLGDYRGPYGLVLQQVAVDERHATDIVATVLLDYRAVDTLGEEFILFAAAVGCTALLRGLRREAEEARERSEAADEPEGEGTIERSDAVRALGAALVAPVLVFALYVVAHGHLTPGGGFQGGVIVAGALLLVYAAGQRLAMGAGPKPLVEVGEAAGAAGFALIGAGGLLFAAAALENFLPLGAQGDLLSAGTIPVANVAIGLEVAGAFTLIFAELLEQTSVGRR